VFTPPLTLLQPGYVPFGMALQGDQYSGRNIQYMYTVPAVIIQVLPICGPTQGFTQLTAIGQNFMTTGPTKAFCVFNGTIIQIAVVMNTNKNLLRHSNTRPIR